MSTSTFCSSCGFNNPPGMRFCGNCGTRLSATTGLLSSAAPVAASEFSPDRLGVMMGADLLERFRQAGLEAAGQRRNVTVLFADISGYTVLTQRLDPEEVYGLIQQFSHRLATDVYQYEGMVDKFTGDGLMALFGAPIAHENNAERAVRAALDMLVNVAELAQEVQTRVGVDLQIRIGLNFGSVVVGSVGSNLLMNYTAIGNTVNLASRLEQAATPGTILVSDSVYRQTKALVDYQPTAPLTLKGVSGPVIAYQVIGLKARPERVRGVEGLRAPMIARDAEFNRLQQVLIALTLQQKGQIFILTGEAGLGKTRLTTEFKTLAAQAPVSVIEGQSLTYRRAVPYWVFLDLLRNYLEATPDTPEPTLREKLRHTVASTLGPGTMEALPYLEHLLLLPPSKPEIAERLRLLEPDQLRQRLFLAVRDLLVASARRQPLVVILEDLHWADDASLDLLLFLLDSVRTEPLCLYVIARPITEGPLLKFLEHAKRRLADQLTVIQLQSLSLDQSQQLLLQLLNIPDLPVALRDQILQRAGGNPFYLEEVLRMLVDAQVIRHENSHWRLTPGVDISTLGVPTTLQDLILTRFDRLTESQRRVLQVAAVIGRHFNWAMLNAVLQPLNPATLQTALNQLVDREFIRPRTDASGTEYEFRQVLVSDAIYSTLLKRERGELHGQVGAAIEAVYADQLDSQIELLARHYSWSPRLDRALHYLLLSGQKAARGYASAQARQHYEQALALLPQVDHHPGQALQVRAGLGDVLVFVGEVPAARAHYQAALEELPLTPPSQYAQERAELERKIGITYQRQGDHDQALLHLAAAQHALQDVRQPVPVEQARVLNEIGWINFQRGQFVVAERDLREALELVKATTAYDVIASTHNRLGAVAFEMGRPDEAAQQVRQALTLRESLGDTAGVARLYNNLGMISWRQGRWQSASDNYTQSLRLLEQLGDADGIALGYLNRGILHTDRGNAEAARQDLEASLDLARQTGNQYYVARALMNLGRLWLTREDWAQAAGLLTESERLFAEMGARDTQVDALLLQSELFIGQGDWPQASLRLEQAQHLLTDAKQTENDQQGRVLRQRGIIALSAGRLAEAQQTLKASFELFHKLGDRFEQAKTFYQLARLAQEVGDVPQAHEHLLAAHQTFEALGARLESDRCQVMLKALA